MEKTDFLRANIGVIHLIPGTFAVKNIKVIGTCYQQNDRSNIKFLVEQGISFLLDTALFEVAALLQLHILCTESKTECLSVQSGYVKGNLFSSLF